MANAVAVCDGLSRAHRRRDVVSYEVHCHGDAVGSEGPDVQVVDVAHAADLLSGVKRCGCGWVWGGGDGGNCLLLPDRPPTCSSAATDARSMCAGTVLSSVVMPWRTMPKVVNSCTKKREAHG